MKTITLLAVTALALLSGCASKPLEAENHWSSRSIAPRATRFFLGYDADKDGKYIDYQWRNKKAIHLVAKRYFLNHNPENPFQTPDEEWYAPRPTHSPLPRVWNYVHLEGLAFGAIIFGATTGMSGTGVFVPLPVDSLIATLTDKQGTDEFVAGFETVFRPLGVLTATTLDVTVGEFTDRYGAEGAVQASWVPQTEAH